MELRDRADDEGDVGDDLRREELEHCEYIFVSWLTRWHTRETQKRKGMVTQRAQRVYVPSKTDSSIMVLTPLRMKTVQRCQYQEICRGDALTYRERCGQPSIYGTKQSDRPIARCLLRVDICLR